MTYIENSSPYPGLQYYKEDQVDIFAGRDVEIRKCARQLVSSRVLILHGATGCGKSSFLRAGVKPYLSRAKLPISFEDNPEGFQVIRSTHRPLRQFACQLMKVVEELSNGDSTFGRLRKSVDPVQFGKRFESEQWREDIAVNADAAYDALCAVSGAMKNAPIFVIDQAEEVFTLQDRAQILEGDSDSILEHDLGISERQLNDETDEYFKFLNEVAQSGATSRLVIALRTEYKGRFDDRISFYGHPGSGLTGFYLRDLDKDGLSAAILRPTLSQEDWNSVRKNYQSKGDVAPRAIYNYEIDNDVVDKLATDLLSDRVPSGGILPALQVACLRLWRQGEQSKRTRGWGAVWRITMSDYRRLGKIETQVEEYLTQAIEEACLQATSWKNSTVEVTQQWHKALTKALVREEADGRAVSRRVKYESLKSIVRDYFEQSPGIETELENVIERMCASGVSVLRREGDYISLAHDSLALALYKWSVVFDRETQSMMRQEIGAARSVDKLTAKDLFIKEDEPHMTDVLVPRDLGWDSQLPHYAADLGFDQRLGINLKVAETDDTDNLSAVSGENCATSWPDLRGRIWKKEVELDKAQSDVSSRNNLNNTRIMVAAEWAGFPGKVSSGVTKSERKKHARRWTDILVTDLFVGNALIGPESSWTGKVRESLSLKEANSRSSRLAEVVAESLQEVVNSNGVVQCHKDSGRQLLRFAADICEAPQEVKDYFANDENVIVSDGQYFHKSDPLVNWLLENENENREDGARPRYIVASSVARALATQAGYTAYFGAKELANLSRAAIADRYGAAKREVSGVRDIAARVQKIIQHTLWQVGLPPARWKTGLNRAFVLRLAAVGYFTVEHVRINPNQFVLYMSDFVNSVFESSQRGTNSVRGIRLNREILREAHRECFSFVKFEEYGHEIYDLDSVHAFWSDHGELNEKSIAGEVYHELCELRRETLSQFSKIVDSVSWLRYRGEYHPDDAKLTRAFRLKTLAWNNYKICNFYDSERYMSRASALLLESIESKYKVDEDAE